MLLLQVNTAFQFTGGAGAAESLTRSTAIPSGSGSLQETQRPNVAPGNAVQPGPPVNRLVFRTQNQAQSSVEDDVADGEGVATEGAEILSTQRTNENGEPVNQE